MRKETGSEVVWNLPAWEVEVLLFYQSGKREKMQRSKCCVRGKEGYGLSLGTHVQKILGSVGKNKTLNNEGRCL